MKLQTAFSKALLKRFFEGLRLRLTYAMAESVISGPFKGNVPDDFEPSTYRTCNEETSYSTRVKLLNLVASSFSGFKGAIF